jgi:hypothetical protein
MNQPAKPRGRAAVATSPWRELLLAEEKDADPFRFWGRAVLFVVLTLWGFRFLTASVAENYVGASILHWINLPFHEAGHVIFGFFGDLIRALGGTLGQLLIPAICLGTFLFRYRDPFGASVALWWLGENFMDIGPYIADAQSGQLLLIGGVTGRDVPGFHDWENILIDLDHYSYDRTIGALSYCIGRILMLAALAWGAAILWRQREELKQKQDFR